MPTYQDKPYKDFVNESNLKHLNELPSNAMVVTDDGDKVDLNETKVLNQVEGEATAKDLTSDNSLLMQVGDKFKKFPSDIIAAAGLMTITDNPEYLVAWTDKNCVLLGGWKKDGSFEFSKGCPAPVMDAIKSVVQEAVDKIAADLSRKVNKEDGKSLINSYFAKGVSLVSNDEFLFAFVDASGILLLGVDRTGDLRFGHSIPQLARLFNGKVDKVIGKNLIDGMFADSVTFQRGNGFVFSLVDAENKVLLGLKENGDFYFGSGVPTPIRDFADKFLQYKETGKSLINSVFADGISFVSNDEFLFAFVDYENKVIVGLQKDGKIVGSLFADFVLKIIAEQISSFASIVYVDKKISDEKNRAETAEQNLDERINNIKPTIVEGGSNNPDNIFLTENEDGAITLNNTDKSLYGKGLYFVQPSDNLSEVVAGKNDTIFVIRFSMSLAGEAVKIGAGCVLKFEGGSIYNGTLEGDDTKILADSPFIGPDIVFNGTWDIPYITSNYIVDKTSDNFIRVLEGLLSSSRFNFLEIESDCVFSPTTENFVGLNIPSNTKVIVAGKITTAPNSLDHYYILNIKQGSENIEICGGGEIRGDANSHDYTTINNTHEWGHCIYAYGCKNVCIHNLKLYDAIGDGVAIRGSNVKMYNLTIQHCGRQGITLYDGCCYEVSNCIIDDIYRVAPMRAIDIEPNEGRSKNVVIQNVKSSGSFGIMAIHCDFLSVQNCSLTDCNSAIYAEDAADIIFNKIVFSSSTRRNVTEVTSDCKNVKLSNFTEGSAVQNEINVNNIILDDSNDYGLGLLTGTPLERSKKYENGSLYLFDGTEWKKL